MTTNSFKDCLRTGRLLFLDGAMGTMLQAAGLPPGTAPEEFCLNRPEILQKIHAAYLKAGSNILTSCTFGANPFKIPANIDVFSYNKHMVEVAREAVAQSGRDDPVFVAGNVGPSGQFARPLGPLEPDELIAGYKEQIRGLVAGGADLIFIETQFDLAEARCAVTACRQVCDLPIMASMTFEHGLSLTGSTPEIFAETMQNLGCTVVGTNCSLGPDEMLPVVGELLACCQTPVMAEPNAGMPQLVDDKTIFPLDPEEFAARTALFAREGTQILGGCCGTTPAHIAALVHACRQIGSISRKPPVQRGVTLTSRSSLVRMGTGNPLVVIGERINPTGKSDLTADLQNGEFGRALSLADAQVAAGCQVLDVNVGAPLVDEEKTLAELTALLVGRLGVPLSLDSASIPAIARALPYCPGSCLVNSISGEQNRMEQLGPLCRQYGSPFIMLPLTGKSLPETARERIAILERLCQLAEELHIPSRLIVVDILALTVSSAPQAAVESLKLLAYCRERELPTTIGLSNISFGLPARALLNGTFLALARGAGLSSCIANPAAPRIRETLDALTILEGYDKDGERFIAGYADWRQGAGSAPAPDSSGSAKSLYQAVLKGDREGVLPILETELAHGKLPLDLVNEVLIPAITEVGSKYEKREYFLPQLIRSAETMKKAFNALKPALEKAAGNEALPVIVMATVEGDIHDIGKNIVALLLGNHGFEVIDAGKDVPASEIVACARQHNASLIGLSALMTTTMPRMQDTINLLKQENLPIKVLVGGAAVTEEFANSIGADAYSEDAVQAVAAAKKLIAHEPTRGNR